MTDTTRPTLYRIRTLNTISASGLSRLPSDLYELGPDVADPDALLVRSANLHELEIPPSVLAVARAGVGVNNIPVEALSERGVPVFNTPGANANAVKELVFAGALLAARNLFAAAQFVRDLPGDDDEIESAVEAGKKAYVGFELPGRTMGVIGLGAIGVQVANAARSLGMRVLGYDPQISVQAAWQLSSEVKRAESLEEVFRRADVVTLHVPLTESTRGLVNTQRLAMMKQDAILLNFSRAGIIDEKAVIAALDDGTLRGYVCDFPSRALNRHPRVMALPHLGASTIEAEDNSAAMAADELRSYLEHGEIENSVNFADARLPRGEDTVRLVVTNRNVPNIVGQVTTLLAEAGLNIADLLNKSRGELAITLLDVSGAIPEQLVARLRALDGVLGVRVV